MGNSGQKAECLPTAVGGPHEHVHFLPDDLEDLVLLQHLHGGVEERVVTVHDCLDKAEVAGHHALEVVGDEDLMNVEPGVLVDLAVPALTLDGLLAGSKELERGDGLQGEGLGAIIGVGEAVGTQGLWGSLCEEAR